MPAVPDQTPSREGDDSPASGRLTGCVPLPADFPTQGGTPAAVIFYVCYLPLLLWGPLLAAVAYAYHRRRQARLPPAGRGLSPETGDAAPPPADVPEQARPRDLVRRPLVEGRRTARSRVSRSTGGRR
jgi:hypothetical protein